MVVVGAAKVGVVVVYHLQFINASQLCITCSGNLCITRSEIKEVHKYAASVKSACGIKLLVQSHKTTIFWKFINASQHVVET